jgi:hypothetical protein
MVRPFEVKIIVAALVLGLGPFGIARFVNATCPHTEKIEVGCPEPKLVTFCESYTSEGPCNGGKHYDLGMGFWDCHATLNDTECVQGLPTDLDLCHERYDCEWNGMTCVKKAGSRVVYFLLAKRNIACSD